MYSAADYKTGIMQSAGSARTLSPANPKLRIVLYFSQLEQWLRVTLCLEQWTSFVKPGVVNSMTDRLVGGVIAVEKQSYRRIILALQPVAYNCWPSLSPYNGGLREH